MALDKNKKLLFVGVGALLLWYFLKPKTASAATRSETDPLPVGPPAPPTTPPATEVPPAAVPPPPPVDDLPPPPPIDSIAPTSTPAVPEPIRYTIKKGDSWSGLAKKTLNDYRWWPFVWDWNRAFGTPGIENPDVLKVGMVVIVPRGNEDVLKNDRYKAAIFARAQAHADWWRNKVNGGRTRPFPQSVYEITDPRTV
jgi:hypothetical protein